MLTSPITFPGLGLELDPPSYIPIGDFKIHFYGIIIAFGLLLAVIYGMRRCKQFGIKADDLLDGVLWVVPFAIICARLYYCVFEWDGYVNHKDGLLSLLYIWEGGLAIYGGVIGAALGIIVFCKIKKISVGAVFDLVGLGFLIGQAIGRWGNFFNREAFGAQTDIFIRMGLVNSITGQVEYWHPTFLYESLWNTVGFVMLHFMSKKRKYDGQIALGYVAWYGLGRALIEGLRMDSLWWGPFRVSQLLAAVSCVAAVIVLFIMWIRPHDPARLYVNRVAAKEKSSEADEDTEYDEDVVFEDEYYDTLDNEDSEDIEATEEDEEDTSGGDDAGQTDAPEDTSEEDV